MKRGLVIGKFLPLHRGHIALINFAASQCEELIVSMSFTAKDPIPPALRFSWITETFKNQKSVRPEMVLDDFDDEAVPISQRVEIWAKSIKKRFSEIDVMFSSEEYGDLLGKALGAPHISFDLSRKQFPVSTTAIRERPFPNWNFIPEVVRPYFVKKICFYGPESTGKSFLAKHLATEYQTEYVPEVARELITSNDFTVQDIIRIGHAQTHRVLEKVKTANKFLFCDTDLITTQIYSEHYLHQVPAVLNELEKLVTYDLYFLFDIDVPWVSDGLRDLGAMRSDLYAVFRSALEKRDIPFVVVSGNFVEREKSVRKRIDQFLASG